VVTYGTPSTTEGTLSVPQKLYGSVEGGGDVWERAATFDDAGEAEVTVPVPALEADDARKPWRYSLSVRAKDDQGTFANASKASFLAESDLLGAVLARQRVVRPGDVARFSVRATTLSGRPYGATAGEVQFVLLAADGSSTALTKQAFTTADDGVARLDVKGERPGVVEAQVTLKDKKGLSWTGTATALVLGGGGEAVMQVPTLTLEALGGALQPGDTAEIVGLLPAGWGVREANEGSVWVTLTGAGLFKTEKLAVKGQTVVYRFPVERRFGSAVYAALAYPSASGRWEERIAGFRIVPKERTLAVSVEAERTEASPLTTQTLTLRVTDHEGRPVQAQVSVGVVDKAVYALQSEFRPGIVDFFYPVGRDNVSTFFSSEFQGYGYGDRIAQALAGLPKSQFAAVKPPTKPQKEDDTVYWNPAVVTDRDGRAAVSFKLNSMQTLWTVTAVAVDASGRFGEAGAEFATRGALVVAANLPQFLRQGDVATGSIRVTPGQQGPGQGTVTLEFQGTGAAAFDARRETLTLAKGGEALVPVTLEAKRAGEVSLGLTAKGLGDPVSDVKRLPVLPAALDEEVAVSVVGGGALELPLPKGAQVLSSRLSLAPSLVDVALGNARELLTYPHGCVEQLVATTVPNVALHRTLQRLEALDGLDKESLTLLAEARSRAVQGTGRILDMAVKGGGFTWFSGYQEPSLEMTLIALDGLAYAVEAGLLDRSDGRLTASAAWLEARADVPPALEATRTYVLARLQGARQAAKVRQLVEAATPEDLYGLALAVLAAEHAGVAEEAGVKERIAALADESRKGVISNAILRADDSFFRYPLRTVGFTAILAHAASRKDVDVDRTRARVLQLLADPSLSTFERSTALLHSQWLVERDIKAMKRLTPPSLEGTTAALAPSGFGLAATLEPSAARVTVGAFDGVATWRAKVRTPLEDVQARGAGLALARAYFTLEGDKKVPLTGPVKQGADVYVELTLDARPDDRWRSVRSAYTVLEDAIPAGFTVLQEDKAYRGAPLALPLTHEAVKKRAFTPERITWYLEEKAFWSASPRVLGYVLRANFPGTFVAPPATLEDMYSSQVSARTASARLSIVK
ncbi:MAG: alpha-2-macroglobulin, partial [Myxococcaceae bacterium]|nr:alpha-2-macroglobulin [Myxococcaceae bacterium]